MEKIQVEVAKMIENPSWQDDAWKDVPIMSNGEFNTFLRNYLNNSALSDGACNQMKGQLVVCGLLLIFNELVILKPQWLADKFKAIISMKNEGEKEGKDGILSVDKIIQRLKLPVGTCNDLISIWEKELNVCIAHPNLRDKYIIPSLLSEKKQIELDTQWNNTKSRNECVGRMYTLPFLPVGIFEGIFVKMFRISDVLQFWRNGLILREDDDDSLLFLEITTNKNSQINSTCYIIIIQATG